jgi:serine O-acetyltransferase
VVVKEVPPNATVVGIPGRVVISGDKPTGMDLEHNKLPDPVAKAVNCMMDQISRLEEQLKGLVAEQQQLKNELAQASLQKEPAETV